jgi:hypothetical protein
MVKEGWVCRLGAKVAVVGVEKRVQAKDGDEIELGPSKNAEGGPGSGA